jgi:Zn-dependent protease
MNALLFICVFVGWIFSVCLHEFGHAWIAFKGGDHTVEDKGYLSMNPIHYAHPVYSFVLPLVFLVIGGIGLPGGAVYINEGLLRSKGWRSGVSLAGPAMNLLLALLLCVPFWFHWVDGVQHTLLPCTLALLIQLQICAVLFNLLPVPSLDGFGALAPWLPHSVREHAMVHSQNYVWILFIAFFYVAPVSQTFWMIVQGVTDLLHIDSSLIWAGWNEFRFWKSM